MNPSLGVLRVGLISDTHNLVRPEALQWLTGCQAIVHAGDVCAPHVLDTLAQIAPVTAVRGNNDVGPWADALPGQVTLAIAGIAIHVVHDIADLTVDPHAEGIDVVVTGHSHKPSIARHGGVLFVNPGSAGPRRFRLPVSAGMLVVEGGRARAQLHTLVG
jgi:putative phosphoesterase